MTGAMLPLLVAVPLVAAAVLVLLARRTRSTLVVLTAVLALGLAGAVATVVASADGGTLAHGVGLWPVGIAIPFAADMLTALMLTATMLLTLTCTAFAIASGFARRRYFAPLVLVLTAGVNGALLTADLFNLFVFIEVMLLPSYALFILAAPGKARLRRIAGARMYVLVNLLTSTVFLAGVAFVYGVAGTVNLAELAGAAASSDAVAVAMAICLFALSIKAAVFPVHGWLTQAYPATSPAMTAMFSGLHTKVAIYAIYRIYAVVFEGDSRFLWIGVVAFTVTMIVGVLGAVGEKSPRAILTFNMVSGIGYILMGVALFGVAGLAAGIFYLIHHMIVKASLFLSTGAIEVRYGTGSLDRLGGLARREPLIAVAFFAAALSLAGIPPFSGFVGKLGLVLASVSEGQLVAAGVMVLASLVTLMSMLKIWSNAFWGKPQAPDGSSPAPHPWPLERGAHAHHEASTVLSPVQHPEDATHHERSRISLPLALPAVFLVVVSLALGLGAEFLLGLSETAAQGLVDTSGYVEAVLNS
ncbi:monovalent cation/H+ antiporter subunit D family protein [Demequina activiva]|uniref:Cation:proton antiporter n=1 Tax=Demequina activiva TaxID=1582364 RepID=A0A919Q2C4_9MICO|nr:monovalent cation/H+ antiporter subunit D family protein [Demequina activiva]GIG54990.1 cation:proton antiporter [Demequina activiva]